MSLFDVDSQEDVSSAGTPVTASDDDAPLRTPPRRPLPQGTVEHPTASSANEGERRNMLTEAELQSAQRSRRERLAERLVGGPGSLVGLGQGLPRLAAPTASAHQTAGGGGASVFGSSIAEAARMRRAEQEKALLRRIRRERDAEAGDATLVEKDLQVGVFVTAAYRQMLRRNRGGGGGGGDGGASSVAADEEEREANEDVLEVYLRKLEAARPASAPGAQQARVADAAGDYYDRRMRAELVGEQTVTPPAAPAVASALVGPVADTSEAMGGAESQDGPSLTELQSLLVSSGADAAGPREHPTPTAAPGVAVGKQTTPDPSVEAARAAHERMLFMARESRKRRRADAAFVAACAMRAEERFARSIGIMS